MQRDHPTPSHYQDGRSQQRRDHIRDQQVLKQ